MIILVPCGWWSTVNIKCVDSVRSPASEGSGGFEFTAEELSR